MIIFNYFNWKISVRTLSSTRPRLETKGALRPSKRPQLPAFPSSRIPGIPRNLPPSPHSRRSQRSSVPGIPCAPRSRRSSRRSPSARQAPPGLRRLARPRPQFLVPPTPPRYWAARRGLESPAPPIGELLSPLRGFPNAERPRPGIGCAPPRPALRSPARQAGPADPGEPGWPFWLAAAAGP